MAISSMPGWPKGLIHQPIPDLSISCPISRSSGTKVASCSRERLAYRLLTEVLPRVHANGVVDVGLLVDALAAFGGLLVFGDDAPDHPVQPRTAREAVVLREEDGDLFEFLRGELAVLQGGVHLDLGQVLLAERGDDRQRHQ